MVFCNEYLTAVCQQISHCIPAFFTHFHYLKQSARMIQCSWVTCTWFPAPFIPHIKPAVDIIDTTVIKTKAISLREAGDRWPVRLVAGWDPEWLSPFEIVKSAPYLPHNSKYIFQDAVLWSFHELNGLVHFPNCTAHVKLSRPISSFIPPLIACSGPRVACSHPLPLFYCSNLDKFSYLFPCYFILPTDKSSEM